MHRQTEEEDGSSNIFRITACHFLSLVRVGQSQDKVDDGMEWDNGMYIKLCTDVDSPRGWCICMSVYYQTFTLLG